DGGTEHHPPPVLTAARPGGLDARAPLARPHARLDRRAAAADRDLGVLEENRAGPRAPRSEERIPLEDEAPRGAERPHGARGGRCEQHDQRQQDPEGHGGTSAPVERALADEPLEQRTDLLLAEGGRR